ncbi:hypothetical protein HME9302_02578 [Alteripontixanthobacter maritimus]|uniref:Uncharacterized protein n=1 Tax=Alteripontixanthobacter maritimus TaxID=2161824 RepID=A0A369QDR1_9SPHN|nr:hypothetical protein [Alteripontixanthobacter maritimus]RDC61356.1 hypothetical protein HME9302_02578 [Alteripontixanthobacter maritimus]
MAKKPKKVTKAEKARTENLPDIIDIGGEVIKPTQLYMDNGRKPSASGPWTDEPDKLSWTDPATELHCTILRMPDGALAGFVAVPLQHPLFGFDHEAIPADVSVEAYGGLNYSEPCDDRGPEATSVCHTHDFVRGRDARKQEWWFGFRCNHRNDFLPGRGNSHLRDEEGRTYRGTAFVFKQCTLLAQQLANIDAEDTKQTATKQIAPPTSNGKGV